VQNIKISLKTTSVFSKPYSLFKFKKPNYLSSAFVSFTPFLLPFLPPSPPPFLNPPPPTPPKPFPNSPISLPQQLRKKPQNPVLKKKKLKGKN